MEGLGHALRGVFANYSRRAFEAGAEGKVEKSQKEITSEIQAIIRQITASVTFLPLLDEPCTFDLLVYTDNDVDVPQVPSSCPPVPPS